MRTLNALDLDAAHRFVVACLDKVSIRIREWNWWLDGIKNNWERQIENMCVIIDNCPINFSISLSIILTRVSIFERNAQISSDCLPFFSPVVSHANCNYSRKREGANVRSRKYAIMTALDQFEWNRPTEKNVKKIRRNISIFRIIFLETIKLPSNWQEITTFSRRGWQFYKRMYR